MRAEHPLAFRGPAPPAHSASLQTLRVLQHGRQHRQGHIVHDHKAQQTRPACVVVPSPCLLCLSASQWPSARRCLTISPSKSAFVLLARMAKLLTWAAGIDVHHQARHCQHQQADRVPPGLRQVSRPEQGRRTEAGRRAQPQCCHPPPEQARRHQRSLQGRARDTDQGARSARYTGACSQAPQNMKESKDRTEQFMYSTAAAANQAPQGAHSLCWPHVPLTWSARHFSRGKLIIIRAPRRRLRHHTTWLARELQGQGTRY